MDCAATTAVELGEIVSDVMDGDEIIDVDIGGRAIVGGEMNEPSGFVFGEVDSVAPVEAVGTGVARGVTDVSGDVEGVIGVMLGSDASRLRLRSSDEPPHAVTARMRAADRRERRLEFTRETLFRFVTDGSSAHEIRVAHNRQAEEQRLEEEFFVDVQGKAPHCFVDVVDGGSQFADPVRVVSM